MKISTIKNPLISICIPTYNRCEKVCKLVTNILKYEGEEIEVIVLDNCSTDDTETLLSEINDPRFYFYKNDENIGGQLNQLKVITLAKAKFAFFCLDKDFLDHNMIKELINHVYANTGVAFGHCSLNLKTRGNNILYNKGLSSIINMAYLSQHPTGLFYEADTYKNLDILKQIFEEKKHFPFYPDLMNAAMAMTGKSLLINLPAFYTESKDDCRTTPSFTYNESNAYFSPARRLIEFDIYLQNVLKLGLSKSELTEVINKLYNNGLMASTFGYKYVMADYDVCAHHGMHTRKVGMNELWKTSFSFSSHFMKQKLPISQLAKLIIVSYGHLKILVKSVLLK